MKKDSVKIVFILLAIPTTLVFAQNGANGIIQDEDVVNVCNWKIAKQYDNYCHIQNNGIMLSQLLMTSNSLKKFKRKERWHINHDNYSPSFQ